MAAEGENNIDASNSICNVHPTDYSSIKIKHKVIIASRPCEVLETHTSKTGKHGGVKVHLIGIDMLDSSKREANKPGQSIIYTFDPIRTDYTMIMISDGNMT